MFMFFFIADVLHKFGLCRQRIILIMSVLYFIMYGYLLVLFYDFFHSLLILAAVFVLLILFYVLRMYYLNRYLDSMAER